MIRDGTVTAVGQLKAKPIAAGVVAGLLASLCCGGSLIFASADLGVFYSSLGLARYTPQTLAAGALSILAINYLYYSRAARQESAGGASVLLRQKMFVSTAIGFAVMAGSVVFMEWLNHAVVHADRFLARPEYGQALIKGVPNTTVFYVCATFFALAALWALPFPGRKSSDLDQARLAENAVRVAVLGATMVLLFGVVLDASSKMGGTSTGQHERAH